MLKDAGPAPGEVYITIEYSCGISKSRHAFRFRRAQLKTRKLDSLHLAVLLQIFVVVAAVSAQRPSIALSNTESAEL